MGRRRARLASASERDTTPAEHTPGCSAACHAAQYLDSTVATAASREPECVAEYCISDFVLRAF